MYSLKSRYFMLYFTFFQILIFCWFFNILKFISVTIAQMPAYVLYYVLIWIQFEYLPFDQKDSSKFEITSPILCDTNFVEHRI